MKSDDVLLEAWEKTLARKKGAPAIFNTRGGAARTFHQVEAESRDFEAKIDNFVAGSVVAIQIGNHEDWPSIFIACLRRKLVILPIEQSISGAQPRAALKICEASAVVAAGSRPAGTVPVGRNVEVVPIRRSTPAIRWGKNPPALLKLTSGTTAAPRAIRFRSEQLLADCNQICETMGISDADLNFGVIPVSHSYGFSNLLTPLVARGVPVVLSDERLPRAVLGDLSRTNATVFPGMPVFYQAFCEMEDVPVLTKLRLCISAGAPLPIIIAKKFREKFKLKIHSFYGASECGGICYDREAANEVEGFVGSPMKDVNLEIIDPAAESSQVRVRSVAAGDGYFPEPDEEKLRGGRFVPDDLLTRYRSGFRIVGRISDIINVAGKKVKPAEVEAHLLRFPGVRQAIAFGRESTLRNEEVAACVVTDVDVSEAELLEFCRLELSGWQVPKRIFVVDVIPMNDRGKVSRRELARRFAA
jgi:long-chain acyl-CoA synthetase